MPITLTSFEGYLNDESHVELEWVVASQLNNDYFVVEHSIDGYVWEEIDNILGAGTTSDLITYNTTHTKPINGYNYYRLTQVDYDRQFEIFNPISVIIKMIGRIEYIVRKTNLIGQDINEYYSGPILILWNNGEVSREFNLR